EGGLRADAYWMDTEGTEARQHLDPVEFPQSRPGFIGPLSERSVDTRAIERGETVYEPDLAAVPRDELPQPAARRVGPRTTASIPLRQGERVLGVLGVSSTKPNALSARQLGLLESFADQAVIAIENARLFQELNDSNAGLKEALERETATADVLAAISR